MNRNTIWTAKDELLSWPQMGLNWN